MFNSVINYYPQIDLSVDTHITLLISNLNYFVKRMWINNGFCG